jgi:predicted secreted protein
MTVAGISAPANAAPGDNTEALAQFLGSNLLTSELLNVGTAESGSPGGPPTDTNPLNLQALQALGLELQLIGDGLEVPLITDGTTPGLLNLGQAGAIQNYAATTPTGAVAASGLISNDGTIAISENASPTDLGNSSINLTSLLSQLGIAGATGPVIDTLALQIGALASRIETTPGQPTTSAYRVTDLKAQVHSALVAALATSLRNAGVSVGGTLSTSVNGLVGTGGVLTGVVNAVPPIRLLGLADVTLGQPTIAVDIANLGAVVDTVLGSNAILVSDNGAVTINLTSGTVTINLAAVVNPGGTGLNGRPANTSVLTTANIATITAGVTNALGKITAPLTTALDQAVRGSSVTISLQVRATLLPALGNTGTLIDAPITIRGTLQQLATGQGVVDTSGIRLLPGIPLCIGAIVFGNCVGVNLNGLVAALLTSVTTSVVTPLLTALAPAVTGILNSTSTSITAALNGVVNPLLAALNPVLDGVLSNVADITINEQPQLRTPPEAADLGTGSATVRALSVTLLPRVVGTSLAKISLASSTVRAQTVDIVETTVRAGNPITVNGAGWVAGTPVTVAFTDGAGNPVGTPVSATPVAAGTYSFPFTIPVGTVGPVTATATQNGVTARDTVAVTAPPSLNILETAVTAGGSITVLGANWSPAGPVSIAFSNAAGAVGTPVTPTPLSDGTFSVGFTVPPGTTGPLTATATQGADVRQDTVAITPPGVPALNIVETSVVEGDPITITGSSWSNASTVSVEVRDGAGTVIDTSARQPAGGTFSFAYTVPVGTVGPVTAVATQGGDTAQDSVAVVPLPSIDIVETTVVEGTTVTVNGSNWTPAAPVSIRYSTTANAQLGDVVTVTPIDNGSFTTTFLVPVGTQTQVTATATQGARSDSDQVLVTALPIPPSMDVTQDSVVAGTAATVTGANWDPTLIVGIEFTNADGVVGTSFTTPDDDGSFVANFVVPVGTVGPVTATATQAGVSLSDVFDVTPAPAIAVVETTVVEGDTVVVPGTDWIPGVTVSLTFTDGDGATILPVVPTTPNSLGAFEEPWLVPVGTVGPVTVVASQPGSNPATDSFDVTPIPTVDITETTVVAGGTVEVTGENWSSASPVTIVFTDSGNQPVGDPVTVTPNLDGSFDTDFAVPATATGTLTATASQNGRTATDTLAVTPPPAVDIVETTVVAGDPIRVNGSNFDPDDLVAQVVVTDGNGDAIGSPFFTGISGAGTFTFPVTVPVGTVGPVTVTATAGGASPSDSVVVTDAPSIDITDATVVAGQPITALGADWVPGPVSVAFTDGDGLPIGDTVTATADGDGAFTTTITVPVGTTGPVTVTATQGARAATDTVAVTPAPPTDPAVDIVEDTVVAGEQITVNGVNWNPDAPLTIALSDGDSLPLLPSVSLTPNGDGSFTVLYTVPVGTVGPVRVLVTQDADTATDTAAVTGAPLGSPAIDIEQSTVVAGQPITIVGGNWDESPLTINFVDANGTLLDDSVTLTPDDGGTFSTTFTVPVGTVGPLRALAIQGESAATDTVAVTPAPVADIVEATVVAGQPITVTGANWVDAPLSIVLLDGALLQVGPPVLLTPAGGAFATTWTVPVGTTGPITARVTQGDFLASDTVLVTPADASAPAIDIVEATVPAGQPITVNGVNWGSGTDVSIVFTDANANPIGTAVLATPVDGAFTTTVTVPVGTVGPVRAIATQGDDLATDTVAVTAPLPEAPTADITETTVVAGQDITVTGENWADAPLSIAFTDGNAGPLGSVAVTPVDGAFSVGFTVPVGTVGPVRATVTQGDDQATDTVAVTPAPGPAPTADITETTVVAGETITLTGENWETAPLSILFTDGNDAPIEPSRTLTPDGDGTFSTTLVVPVGTVGPVRATVAQGGDSATDTVIVTPAPAPLPSADILENSVVAGENITVTGANWADTELTIIFTDVNSAPIGTGVTLTPVDGVFSTSFTIPVGTLGPVRANVRQGLDFAADSVIVTPAAMVAPTTDIVQTTVEAGQPIDVTGANWADTELTIVFTDGDGNAVGLPVTVTPVDGAFAIEYTVPVGTVGPLRANVTQGDDSATDTVAVTPAPAAAPTLDIVEDTVVAGQDIEVTGSNWQGSTVTILFTDANGSPVGLPVSATPEDGEFSVDFTVPVGTVGPLRATATQGASSATDTVAVTPAPVAAPTVDIAETTVVEGQPITVTGENWADAPLSIVFTDGLGAAIDSPVSLTPVDGAFSIGFTVPVGTTGPLRATVTQGDDTATDTVAVTSAPAAPTVDIAETTVVAGEPITVTGSDWADAPLSIVYTDGVGTQIGAPVVLTPTGGTFSDSFTVPVGTSGPVRVTVTQGDDTATDTVAVTPAPGPAPTADITETTVVAGEDITVTGANWADTPLTVVLTDVNGAPIGSALTLTPEDGVFSTTITVPVGTAGPVRATVSQGDDTATDTVAVTPAPGPAPTADITETTVVAGESITVTGANWADAPLSIVFTDSNAAPVGAPVVLTPVDGVFSTAFTVPVGTSGPLRATVTQGDDTATDTVAVTAAPGPAPTADILETTVVAGQDITVTGANWADTPLSISITDGDNNPIGTPVSVTPVDGVFTQAVTIPVGTTGPVRATVTQGDDTASDTVAVTAAPGPAPTVDILETTVVAGEAITVTGANWADTPLSIVIADGNGNPIGTPITLTPEDGVFSTSVTVPVGTTGPVRATVTQGDDTATDTVAVTPAPGPAPTADILEDTVVAGEAITVTGANWADTPVSIVIADGNGNPIGTPIAVTPVDGVFSTSVTVPVGTTGPVRATVSQGDDSATDTVAVTPAPGPAPTADILETTVVAGEAITVTGSNWADTPLSIVIADGNGNPIGTPILVTPEDGEFSTSVTVPVGATGPVRATVTQGDDTATDTVAVTPAPGPAPSADILETTVVAGQPITVTGENWADAPLSIAITDGTGTPIGTPITLTPEGGEFSTSVTVPVGTTGPVRATVTQGDDTATDTVAVTAAPGPAPVVDILEDTVVAGESITVTGSNWADTPVSIVIADGNGNPIGTPISVTPVDGVFSTPVTVPVGTTGPVTATVSQGDDTAIDTVAVTPAPGPAPAVDILEDTVVAGETITVNGENWVDTPVSIVISDGNGNPIGTPITVTPVDGAFSETVTVPVGTTGPVRATVTQGDDSATDTVAVTPAPGPAPAVDILETTIVAGEAITVTGTNWADTPLSIVIADGNGNPIGTPILVTPEDGEFSTSVTVPVGTTGPVRATVTQGDDTATDTVAVTPAPGPAPSVDILEDTVVAGQPITVNGSNWADTPVSIVIADGNGIPIGTPISVTPVDGSFSTSVTIPVGTTGPVRATVTQGDDSAADTVAVTPAPGPAPVVDIVETTVVAGDPITVNGSNWADTPVSIVIADGNGNPIGTPISVTPVDGAFSTSVTIPVGTTGPVRATVTQGDDSAADTVAVTPAPGPAPSADIVETTVVAGETITVTGENWADTPVSIVIADGNGNPVGTPISVTPEDGEFTTSVTIPVGTTGPVRATVTQGDDSATDTVAVTPAPGPAPSVDIDQATVVAGQPIDVTGADWEDTPLTVVYTDGNGAPIGTPVALTPVDGDFAIDFTVPVGTTGPVRVTVTQGDDIATDTVAVTPAPGPAPTADITETTVEAGQPITVTGADWADAPLSIVIADGAGNPIGTPIAVTPVDGEFSTSVTIPVGTTGPVRATVTQGDDTATDTVAVTAAPGPAPAVDILETTVVAGDPITVTGENWADTPVSIVISDGNGNPIGTPISVTPVDGEFTTSVTIPVGTTGPVRATVTQGDDSATDTVAVTPAPGPAPSADILETTVEAGQPITVTGENWADTPLSIVIADGNGNPIGTPITVTPVDGEFSTSVTIPVGTTGPVRATVTQGDDSAADTVAVTPAPGPAPAVDIVETTVVAGETITVNGSNWADTPVSIVIADGNGNPVGTPIVLTPVDGAFSTPVTVPVGTTGPVRVTVTQGDDTATDTVAVTPAPGPAPTADILETTVVAGETITVTGANWADTPVSIVIADGNGNPIGTPISVTPADGAFSTTVTVPVGTTGPVRATVTQGDDTATDTVAVTPAPGPAPSVDIDQATVVAGQPIDVTGANWADTPLTIVFTDGNGTPIGAPVTLTPDDGDFAIDFTVPEGTTGPVRVTVTQGDDIATDTVAVTPAPVGPSADITETTVVAGENITVTGQNWADAELSIVFTDGADAQLGLPVALSPVDGAFSTTFTVPVGTTGPVRATVVQGDDTATDTVIVTAAPGPAPVVDIEETTVVAGQDITLAGVNWADAPLSIVFTDGDGAAIGTPIVLTPVGGGFSIEFTVPVGTDGPVRATVTQGDDSATDTVAVTPAPGPAPAVDIVETTVVAGETVTVNGSNWADTPVTIVVSDGNGNPIGTPIAVTPVDGAFTVDVTVPVGTTGPVRVTVTQGDDSATDTVAVTPAPGPAPSVDIVETTVVAGQPITVTGENWADAPLTIVVTDGNGVPIGDPIAVTPVDGAFTTTVPVPAGTTGPVRVTVTQGDDTATDTVAVTPAPGPDPSVDIDQTTVVAGQPIDVTGANWADTPLSIVFTDGLGAPIGAPVTLTPADGIFSIDFTVPVGTTGPVRVTVTQGDELATDTVAVTPAPAAPTADITETTVEAGQDITVTGANWADAPLSIVFSDGNGAAIALPVSLTPVDGVFSTTFTVPVGTTGPVRATVTQGDDTATDTVAVTAAPGPAPTADITETSVEAGQDITVTGANWADAPLSIVFSDGNGAAIGLPVSLTPVDGVFSTTFTVPVGTTGPVRATVTQGDDTATDTVAVTAAPGPAPTADIVETTVEAGQDITVTGANWADAPLSIVFSDGTGAVIALPVSLTPTDGVFSTTFTVPVGTTGPVRATVTQGDDTATDTVAVTPAPVEAPSLDIVETTVVAGQPITTNGAGWNPGLPVSVVFFDGEGHELGPIVDVTPGVEGEFSLDYTVPVGTVGPVRATATQGADAATDTVAVTPAPTGTPFAEIVEDAVFAGEPITLTGEFWDNTSAVTITLTDENGDVVEVVSDVPDEDGSVLETWVVPSDLRVLVRATFVQGKTVSTDKVDVLVAPSVSFEPPTAQPGDTVTVVGSDWTPGTPITIVFTDGDGNPIGEPITVTPNEDGSFDVDWTVPPGTVGPVTVTVTQDDRTATDTLAIPVIAAAATVSQPRIDRGFGAVQTVTGTGFRPGESVTVTVASAGITTEPVIASSAGTVTILVPVGFEFPLGATRAEVVGSITGELSALQETTDFEVVASDNATGRVLNPSIVRGTGEIQTVIGELFEPGETVSATVYSLPMSLGTRVADANGQVVFTFPVGADFELGGHYVDLIGSISGNLPGDREFTRFTVLSTQLASTGPDSVWLAGLAMLLLLAGVGTRALRRRSAGAE